jgi:cytochrome b
MYFHKVFVINAGGDMSIFHKIRIFHAVLAVLVIAAYFSDDMKALHPWLGYAVAALILFRIVWAALGPRQVGLSKLFPNVAALKEVRSLSHPMVGRTLLSAMVISLLVVIGAGVTMLPPTEMVATETVSALEDEGAEERQREEHKEHGALKEIHEIFANLLMILVILHASYFLAFKRPMALFMLFLREAGAPASRHHVDQKNA